MSIIYIIANTYVNIINFQPIFVVVAVVNSLKSNLRQSSAERDAQKVGSLLASLKVVKSLSTFRLEIF